MFDPTRPEAIQSIEDKDLSRLPNAEDGYHEYKSSLTKDNELATKLERAASGFWNSGGGLFVAGIDGHGRPDGGIPPVVGRQPRRDWIDQVVHQVTPHGSYYVHLVENKGGCPSINSGNVIALVAFAPSEIAPHMANDNRYYLRAGAHTESAGHFIVEAIRSRRFFSKPKLLHTLRVDGFTSESSFLVIELLSVTQSPAITISVDVEPRPDENAGPSFPLSATLIDTTHPLSFRFEFPNSGYSGKLKVSYRDLIGNDYEYAAALNINDSVSSWYREKQPMHLIADEIKDLKRTLERIRV